MMDSVCGLPRTYSRPPGFGHSLLVLVAGSGEGWGGRSPGAGGKGYRLCRSAMNRNRPFRDGDHIGPSHRAICCRRSDGFEAAARTVALTRMNGGKLARKSRSLGVAASLLAGVGAWGDWELWEVLGTGDSECR